MMRLEFTVNFRDLTAFEKTRDYITADAATFTIIDSTFENAFSKVKDISNKYMYENRDWLDDYFICLNNVFIQPEDDYE